MFKLFGVIAKVVKIGVKARGGTARKMGGLTDL